MLIMAGRSRPSICFVAPSAYPVLAGADELPVIGGAELQQVLIARELVHRGYPVSMICLDFGQEDNIEIEGIRVLRAFQPNAGLPVFRFFVPRLTSVWSCLIRANADIYYQRTAGLLTGIVAAYCHRSGKKSIFAAAGNPDLLRKTPRIRFARDRWIYEHGLRHVDRIVVQNQEQIRLCELNYGRDALLIPSCYPVPDEPRSQPGRTILWVSSIRRIKRPELFLQLARALPQYQFRMIGGPGHGDIPFYKSIRAEAELIPNLEFKGFVPYPRVEQYFDDAAIFVNTSESEGFPNTFLQAWARSIPTVSFVDCGARAEGKVVGRHVGSMSELTSCVADWLDNEPARHEQGKICRAYLEANHSIQSVIDLYEDLFAEVMST